MNPISLVIAIPDRSVRRRLTEELGASPWIEIVAETLMEASLSGHDTHGVGRILMYVKGIRRGTMVPGAKMKVVRESESTLLLDGGAGLGPVTARHAFSIASELGLPPEPLVLAVLFGCNLCYATPIAYQTNMLIMAEGSYEFKDYVRTGVPLVLIMVTLLSVGLAVTYQL